MIPEGTETIITAQGPDQIMMATNRGKMVLVVAVTTRDLTMGMFMEGMMVAVDKMVVNNMIVVQGITIMMTGECNERRSCRIDGKYRNMGSLYI